jgi:hypothetical protein
MKTKNKNKGRCKKMADYTAYNYIKAEDDKKAIIEKVKDLPAKQKKDIYKYLQAQEVYRDVASRAATTGIDLSKEQINKVVEDYVYFKRYSQERSYLDNLDSLINSATVVEKFCLLEITKTYHAFKTCIHLAKPVFFNTQEEAAAEMKKQQVYVIDAIEARTSEEPIETYPFTSKDKNIAYVDVHNDGEREVTIWQIKKVTINTRHKYCFLVRYTSPNISFQISPFEFIGAARSKMNKQYNEYITANNISSLVDKFISDDYAAIEATPITPFCGWEIFEI